MSWTQDDINELVTLSAPLVPLAARKSWVELSADEEAAFRRLLPGPGGFDPVQRQFLPMWHLPVTPEQLAAANDALPTGTRITARADVDDQLWLSAKLLSAAIDGGPLAAIEPLLTSLPLTFHEHLIFPQVGEND